MNSRLFWIRLAVVAVTLVFPVVLVGGEGIDASDSELSEELAVEYFKERGAKFSEVTKQWKVDLVGGPLAVKYAPGRQMWVGASCRIVDNDFAKLKYLKSVSAIAVGLTSGLTANCLKHLSNVPNIRAVAFRGSVPPDLSEARHVRYLWISGVRWDSDSEGLVGRQIGAMKELRFLSVSTVTDEFFRHLPETCSIEALHLFSPGAAHPFDRGSAFSGECFTRLRKLRDLTIDSAWGPSESLIGKIKLLSQLKRLDVEINSIWGKQNTDVNKLQKELQEALPNTEITVDSIIP